MLLIVLVGLVYAFKATTFTVKDAYDIKYDGKYLTFKTKSRKKVHSWKFKGECTVWHYESGERCDTLLECVLCDIWQQTQ